MTRITVQLDLPHDIEHVWDRLTDWEAHSEWIPGTRVSITKRTSGIGTEFIGVTRLGPIFLDDPMRVTEFTAPRDGRATCTVLKTGVVLGGTAGFTLTSSGAKATHLEWIEDVHLKPAVVFWWTAPFVLAIGKIAFTSALNKFAATL